MHITHHLLSFALLLGASATCAADWPMLGRDQTRNPKVLPASNPPAPGAHTAETVVIGPRISLSGRCEEADLGDAVHAIFAAEFTHPRHPDRVAIAKGILQRYGVDRTVDASEVVQAADRFSDHIERTFKPTRFLVEMPFSYRNAGGQLVTGVIDLLAEIAEGWILFDHKSFPGAQRASEAKALTYSGQLDGYRQALTATGRHVAGMWIHFPVGGGLVKVRIGRT